LFIRPAGKVPKFPLSEAARIAAEPGQDFGMVHTRLKGLVNRRVIHTRYVGSGATLRYKLGVDDLAAAKVIFALLDSGIGDAPIVGAASVALYAWDEQRNPRPAHLRGATMPIVAALVGAERGDWWALKITNFHHDQTFERRVVAILYDTATPPGSDPTLPPGFIPRSTFTVLLPPLLMPLTRFLRPERGN
jgi:hypothetical protein